MAVKNLLAARCPYARKACRVHAKLVLELERPKARSSSASINHEN